MRKRFLLAVVISFLCVSGFYSNNALAQANRTKAKSLESLTKYVGKYANDKALRHPTLRRSLVRLIGRDASKLSHYTLVQGPIDMVSGDVVIAGCAPHECPDKAAVVVAQLETGEVHAAILERGEIVVYTRQKTREYLPEGLQDWIRDTVQYQLNELGIRLRVQYR